jgi:hypothetical protein
LHLLFNAAVVQLNLAGDVAQEEQLRVLIVVVKLDHLDLDQKAFVTLRAALEHVEFVVLQRVRLNGRYEVSCDLRITHVRFSVALFQDLLQGIVILVSLLLEALDLVPDAMSSFTFFRCLLHIKFVEDPFPHV